MWYCRQLKPLLFSWQVVSLGDDLLGQGELESKAVVFPGQLRRSKPG
jgi:hypothetical protein